MATKKQIYKVDSYKEKLKKSKETYAERKEYLATTTLRSQNVKGSKSGSAVPAENDSPSDGSKSDTIADTSIGDNNAIIKTAKSKIGAKYVLGTEGPDTFDCSGLVYWAYKQNGYTMPRTSAHEIYRTYDSVTSPEIGDILTFDWKGDGRIDHVGLYIDADTMIHTGNAKSNLCIVKLTDYHRKHMTGYRRVPKKYWPSSNKDTSTASSFSIQAGEPSVFSATTPFIGDPPSVPDDIEFGSIFIGAARIYTFTPLSFLGKSIRQSSLSREVFLRQRVGWVRQTQYQDLVSLDKERFLHQHHYDGYEGNLYAPDAKILFENLLIKTKKPYFTVISGFRFSEPNLLSPHEAGCAIDLLAQSVEEAREMADAAWLLGVRSISIGGDFDQNKGFIHIDIAPKGAHYAMDEVPLYGGPGKWEIR